MSTPSSNHGSGSPFPPPRRSTPTPGSTSANGSGASRPNPGRERGNGGGGGSKASYHFHYSPRHGGNTGAGGGGGRTGGAAGGGIGAGTGGGQIGAGGGRANYSPLGDPEFFTNADVRNFCEGGRAMLAQASFDLAMAHEILQAVLKEVPDPEGRPFGSQARARRVARHLKKAADDAKDCAASIARAYAAFQREYDPEISRVATPRAPRRQFNFGG
ncbi:plasmid transfer protein TraA [Kitasatospora sp. NPDC059327]|uniref:plasmid transfer protein TraA n=1 Tax=Kitasatospora sp. NPDC059327 TaxID=3346803 RepID=UPI003692C6A1